jgi:type IV fimbrial biogenesis protein FimT
MDLVLENDMERTTTKGFTLLELLITVTVLGIISSLAIPAFSSLIAGSAMSANVNLFLAQLYLARSSAITRERYITVCPASSPAACSDDHTGWRQGYLIFQDNNRNRQRDGDEELISYQEKSYDEIKIFSSSQARNRITFFPTGRSWFSNTTVRFCHDEEPDLNRAIIVSNTGRVRHSKRMANGGAVSCQ